MQKTSGDKPKQAVRAKSILLRIGICVAVLLLGLVGMLKLATLKKPPPESRPVEQPIRVRGLTVQPEDVTVTITGYGEVRAVTRVSLAPEVAGRVVTVHPRLEPGGIVPRDAVLFAVDPRTYAAAVAEARAAAEQLQATVLRLEKQYAIDRERRKTLARNRDLANAEFERLKQLYEKNHVGTQSGVDKAEQAYNTTVDMAEQLDQAVALYPFHIQEARSALKAARARTMQAEISLENCRVKAPFRARVASESIDIGAHVSPGVAVVTLVDDAVLEIQVPLDSRDVRRWLVFNDPAAGVESRSWFADVAQRPCRIRWTEDPQGPARAGRLHRVVAFDPQTRTVTVAVRIAAEDRKGFAGDALPLVEGMFCTIEIPGKQLANVFRLPRTAVSYEQTLFLVTEQSRLKTVGVEVAHTQGNTVFVSGGIVPGDTVVVTRLTDPLENVLLEVTR